MNKEQYEKIMGLKTRDIGSVVQLRRFVNEKLVRVGYKKLRGYKPKKQLYAINKRY